MPVYDNAADLLIDHRQGLQQFDNIPRNLYPRTPVDAYLVQDNLVHQLTTLNDSQVIGYKLACTNQAIMKLLNVDGPLCGQLMSHSTYQSGVKLKAMNFIHRVMELEFNFKMENDAVQQEQPYTAETIKPLIACFMPGLEIVDYRYEDFTLVGGNALIADNAIHGALIVGEADYGQWHSVDIAKHAVRLIVNEKIAAEGVGENVLGGPLNVMAWLANHLLSRGKILKAGDIVTTGTACAVHYAESGDHISADFGMLGSVACSFD